MSEILEEDKQGPNQLFKQITYVINKNFNLQTVFLSWVDLNFIERRFMDTLFLNMLPTNTNTYYLSIMKAFHYWNRIQDLEGACGFSENPSEYEFEEEEEKFLINLVFVMDLMIKYMNLKHVVLKDIQNFSGFKNKLGNDLIKLYN